MKKIKSKDLQHNKNIYDIDGNRLSRSDIRRELAKLRSPTEKKEQPPTDPVAQALVSLIEELKTNSVLSDENMQKLSFAISETIQQIKKLSESIIVPKESAKRWNFVATKTKTGFVLDAERKE